MKLIMVIQETPRGDVEITIESAENDKATQKELCYAENIGRALYALVIPKIGVFLGAKAVLKDSGRADKQ